VAAMLTGGVFSVLIARLGFAVITTVVDANSVDIAMLVLRAGRRRNKTSRRLGESGRIRAGAEHAAE
jgi:hypothetical protein